MVYVGRAFASADKLEKKNPIYILRFPKACWFMKYDWPCIRFCFGFSFQEKKNNAFYFINDLNSGIIPSNYTSLIERFLAS